MDIDDTATDDIVAQPAPPARSSPTDELTDEDLEVVVGGLGRPWIALRAMAE
jgi:hypothetical protein